MYQKRRGPNKDSFFLHEFYNCLYEREDTNIHKRKVFVRLVAGDSAGDYDDFSFCSYAGDKIACYFCILQEGQNGAFIFGNLDRRCG